MTAWRRRPSGWQEGREELARTTIGQPKGDPVPRYYDIPVLLVVLSLILTGLIFWGGFVEERRNGRSAR